MSSEPPRKRLKAGSNWKKLQKTLTPDDKVVKKRHSASPPKLDKGKHKMTKEVSSQHSTSPATSTALPWFADDLSPEDLALVRQSSMKGNTGVDVHSDITDAEEQRKKRRAILGGEDLSDEKKEPGMYVAIDCEMVGVGPEGSESVLARVSIVNWHGAVLMDNFVKPQEKVTDYRTWVSGVRPQDLMDAPSFQEVQSKVDRLIKGRVLVGHAIHNDLKALLLSHPKPLIRDTAQNKLCREIANSKYPSLRKLVSLRLGIEIQGSEHSPVEDARATMALYRTLHADWQKTTRPQIIGVGWKKKVAPRITSAPSAAAAIKTTNPEPKHEAEWWKKV